MSNDKVIYIVTTERNYWGKGETLKEACENANLRVETPADFFLSALEYDFDIKRAREDWREYGRDEYRDTVDEETEIVIFRFDPEVWEDFSICHVTGGVSFHAEEGKFPQKALDEMFIENRFGATWKNGEIIPREFKRK